MNLKILQSFILSFILTSLFFLWKFLTVELFIKDTFVSKALNQLFTPDIAFTIIIIFIFLWILFYYYLCYFNKVNTFIYNKRWYIALIIFIVCIFFKISGSSAGSWIHISENQKDTELLIGSNRSAHADEYCTYTPMTFAQYFNKDEKFPYFGKTLRATSTDMFIVYGQPVKDIAVIFRPFHFGYLFLDFERGFSFFWCSRLILLFMITFEFLMLFTQKNKLLALISTLLIVFSPTIQWWICVNALVEMLIFGELLVILSNYYMNTTNYLKRTLSVIIMGISSVGYILTFYPASQIPFAYMFAVLILCIFIYNNKIFNFTIKKDGILLLLYLFVIFIGLFYIYSKSADTLHSVMNTVYPGHRFNNGGGNFIGILKSLFHYPFTLTLTLSDSTFYMNTSSWNLLFSFFDFFPVGIIFALILILKEKHRDIFIIGMLFIWLFIFLYLSIGFNDFLLKATLMNYSTGRAFAVLNFLNILLLVRSMSLINIKLNYFMAIIATIFLTFTTSFITTLRNGEFLSGYMFIVILPILFLSFFYMLANKKTYLLAMCIIISFFCGIMANPIRTGLKCIIENELINTIKNISQNQDGKWFIESFKFPFNNLPILAGAPTINSTNVYPNIELMKKLDTLNQYENIYNRYGSFEINITNEPTKFESLGLSDYYVIYINNEDVSKLNATFVLSPRDLSQFNSSNIEYKLIKEINEFKIFKILLKK